MPMGAKLEKRLLDIAGSSLGLVMLAPVFAAIAVAVKLDSQGPVFFRQQRIGLGGRPFSIVKFRSMQAASPGAASEITVRGDARITRVGAFLRKYKLDELPQLFNVFAGSMSLVGPRPEVEGYFRLYPLEQQRIISSVKPGMTDYAAIELRDEEAVLAGHADPQKAYVEVLMPRKFALYKRYIDEQSLALDLKLIWRTVAAILGAGARAS
jgi:lipopolysaccharide/colanic/teichoic acid biosynthesis glycosyltransferase